MIKIIIPIAPITKKNSQQILINKRTGRRFIAPSQQYKHYAKECSYYIKPLKEPIDYEVNVKCIYYMPSRRKTDLTNLMEATHDVLVDCGILKDDNYKIIKSVDGSRVLYDRNNPRTEIYIERVE
ncbi:endodeoxyribonuclease RusA [Clostridium tepidiprofundi DSM 19306]|uniref:Endodeoxyribonuclease RusA n=1 Tax=Clostridium tepidiprofundi DSM 19306 TaxID=1121338 RepID=A0A151B7Z2_9CLOT|nr:RusA family crossover junction endodeoxyribonuclease [Clostridium tepidiprofundi]KYH35852.1 endodeoxyribonuclease RusA [Clostridium tepidiprofundi DSM 19306]